MDDVEEPELTRRRFVQSVVVMQVLDESNDNESISNRTDQIVENADPSIEYGEQGYGDERYGGGLLPAFDPKGRVDDALDRARSRISEVQSGLGFGDDEGESSSEEEGFFDRLFGDMFSDDEPGFFDRLFESLFDDS